jgi:hypothetical protein
VILAFSIVSIVCILAIYMASKKKKGLHLEPMMVISS